VAAAGQLPILLGLHAGRARAPVAAPDLHGHLRRRAAGGGGGAAALVG
jgi:hypothetical protein